MVNGSNVWIIILNWNGAADTIECLESLRAALSGTEHILVIDNGSTDDSVAILSAYRGKPLAPRFEIVETGENLGFGGGNNVGIRRALANGAEWILLLNNDTVVSPGFLTALLLAGERDARIGMLNPTIYLLEEGKPASGGGNRIWFAGGKLNWMLTKGTHLHYGEEDRGQFDGEGEDTPSVRESDYATGCCLLVRRAVIEDIGLLPEAYFLYYEDAEWSLRARRHGWRCVLVPKARIWHRGAASSREHSPAYIRYHVRNGLLFARRMGNLLQRSVAYGMSVARALRQIPKLCSGPRERQWALAILSGILDAWLLRTGPIRTNDVR